MSSTHDRTTGRPDRAERRAAVLDDPRFERFRDRPARRRLALGLVGLLVVETGLLLGFSVVASPTGAALVGVGLVVLLLAFVVLLGALKASTRGVEELPDRVLDEREVQVRGYVYATAYRIGLALLTALLAVVVIWDAAGWPVGTPVLSAVAVVTFHVALVLPTLVAAWQAD